MDHAVLQCCRIYQLEDVHIWPGESPDELVDCLWALADHCNFLTEEEKEQNVKYRFIRALNDKKLVKTLLALDLTAATSKMLEVCCTHIAISDNLAAMGLNQQKSVNVIQKQSKPHHGKKPQADSVHSCGCCTKSQPPGQSSCPAREDKCQRCGKLWHWKPKCQSSHKGTQNKGHPHQGKGGKPKKISEVGTDDYHCDQVGVASVLQAPSYSDPNTIHISDVQIDAATEAFATVEMPAEIGPHQCETLKCKVDTGAGGNVM